MSQDERRFWAIGSDNLVRIPGVRDSRTGTLVSSASISGQMKDDTDTDVGAAIAFAAVPTVAGEYVGTVPAALALVNGSVFTLEITGTNGPDTFFTKVTMVALFRGP